MLAHSQQSPRCGFCERCSLDMRSLFVQFQTPDIVQVAETAVVPVFTGFAGFFDDAHHRLLAHLEHAADGIDGGAFAESGKDQSLLAGIESCV